VLVDGDGNYWFRQSWLGTANRCNERGRLSLIHPEEGSNEAATVGTCTHAAVQAVLEKKIEPSEAPEWVYDWSLHHCATNTIKWLHWSLPSQIADHAVRCTRAFVRELLPHIPPGGQCEVEFKVPLFEFKGHTVGITGTADYIPPEPVLYDWKTATRKFDQRVKQRTDIQPTVYSVAAIHGAFGGEWSWPVKFKYGVMIRGREAATTQLVTVQRTQAHEGWLVDQMRTYLNMATALGVTDTHWPRDEDHYLCNATWCPWWSMCKGARLTTDQDNWSAGSQPGASWSA